MPLAGGAADYAASTASTTRTAAACPATSTRACARRAASASATSSSTGSPPRGAARSPSRADTVRLPGAADVVLVTFEDVTRAAGGAPARRAAGRRDARSSCARSTRREVAKAVGRLAVPAYADWCFVELLQPDGSIVREVIAHADPARRAFADEYDRLYPLDPDAPFGSPRVIRTGEPELMPEISEELLLAARPGRAAARRAARGRLPLEPDRAAARARPRDRRPRAGDRGVRARASARTTSRSPRSWPTAARWRWTTRGCTRSCARPRRRRAAPARRSARSSRAWPTRSPPRRPTARLVYANEAAVRDRRLRQRRGDAGRADQRGRRRASRCSTSTASRSRSSSSRGGARWRARTRSR